MRRTSTYGGVATGDSGIRIVLSEAGVPSGVSAPGPTEVNAW